MCPLDAGNAISHNGTRRFKINFFRCATPTCVRLRCVASASRPPASTGAKWPRKILRASIPNLRRQKLSFWVRCLQPLKQPEKSNQWTTFSYGEEGSHRPNFQTILSFNNCWPIRTLISFYEPLKQPLNSNHWPRSAMELFGESRSRLTSAQL